MTNYWKLIGRMTGSGWRREFAAAVLILRGVAAADGQAVSLAPAVVAVGAAVAQGPKPSAAPQPNAAHLQAVNIMVSKDGTFPKKITVAAGSTAVFVTDRTGLAAAHFYLDAGAISAAAGAGHPLAIARTLRTERCAAILTLLPGIYFLWESNDATKFTTITVTQ